MKKLIIILAIFISGCASHFGEGWDRGDTYRQIAYTAIHVADWGQTHDIIDHGYPEINPAMPRHPTHREADLYIGSALILQTIIPPMLEPKKREIWQICWIVFESTAVLNNFRVGMQIKFK